MAYDRNQPLGIIGAMDVEIELLQKKMKSTGETHTVEYAGMLFMEGSIGNANVVLVKCGVGMVNAAICAEVLIDIFKAAAIINTGVGGSLDNRIDIGDVVIATDAVNHLMDVANLGYHVGETPGTAMVAFPTNLTLHNELSNAADELGIKAHSGRIASGDRFVREDVEKRRIVSEFGAVCCEMEGAAIAQACFLSEVPCAIVRAISDKADGTSSVDYRTFEDEAAKNSAELVAHVLHTSLQG